MSHSPQVVFLMGPTASGKTDMAIELAKRYPVSLISVDSVCIYKGMDIGTGKPNKETLALYPHKLMDILDPAIPYSASDFARDARREIDVAISAGKLPVLVGGTNLYFQALAQGLSDLPCRDDKVRDEIVNEAQVLGWHEMHKKLQTIDPDAAKKIHPNDPQRIIRALEVYKLTGKTLSYLQKNSSKQQLPYNIAYIATMPNNKTILHERIEARFMQMLENGFIEEVKKLYQRNDLNSNMPAIRAVGYRQVWEYLAENTDYKDMVVNSISATKGLAKRQMTWLAKNDELIWLDSTSSDSIARLCTLVEN